MTEIDWGFVTLDFRVFCAISNSLMSPRSALFLLCRDLCIYLDLETPGAALPGFWTFSLILGFDLPLSYPQLLLMPASSLRQDGPPAGNSCGSLPKDQLTSTNAAKIRCEIKRLVLIVCIGEAGRKWRGVKKASPGCSPDPQPPNAWPVSVSNIQWDGEGKMLHFQSRCRRVDTRQWFCKTQPDILLCLFGENGIVWWPNAARLTQMWRQIRPGKLNHTSWCWGNLQALLNKGRVYYQGEDADGKNIVRLLALKHQIKTQSLKVHNCSNLNHFHPFKASEHAVVSSKLHSRIVIVPVPDCNGSHCLHNCILIVGTSCNSSTLKD